VVAASARPPRGQCQFCHGNRDQTTVGASPFRVRRKKADH
jgi:hypothetical protein